jgi:hypothetical protein
MRPLVEQHILGLKRASARSSTWKLSGCLTRSELRRMSRAEGAGEWEQGWAAVD